MAYCRNVKKWTYRSISKAATFRFSYNLSFNPRTTFCVSGKKSFSAIVTRNWTTFVQVFTLRNDKTASSYPSGATQRKRSTQAFVAFTSFKTPVMSTRDVLFFPYFDNF